MDNEKAYYILDAVNNAIVKNCKICFQYAEYSNRKRKVMKNNGEYYTVSLYTLAWEDDFYYMIGWCDNWGHMRNFRLNRIYKTPVVLNDEEVVPELKGFNLTKHSRKGFRMFGSVFISLE